MSIFEEIDERLLKKKDEFVWTTYGNFSKEEISRFQNSARKIWGGKIKIWNHSENNRKLELQIKESESQVKKYAQWTLGLIFVLAVVDYFGGIDSIRFGFASLALGITIIWQQINHKTSVSAYEIKIQNAELAISIIESQLDEFDLIHMPDMNRYMKAYEKMRYASSEMGKEDKTIISEFEVEKNLAILENMGYSNQRIW